MTATASLFGDMIYGYSREQALNDGVLVSLDPKLCHEAGFKFPIAVSDHLWGVINPGNLETMPGQSITGRVWDLLWMFKLAISDPKNKGSDRLFYKLILLCRGDGCPARLEEFNILAVCGPGDSGEPVLTLMFPEDD